MKIFVTVKPNAKEERVEKIDDTHFKVSVKEPPTEGRANWGGEGGGGKEFGGAASSGWNGLGLTIHAKKN